MASIGTGTTNPAAQFCVSLSLVARWAGIQEGVFTACSRTDDDEILRKIVTCPCSVCTYI